MFTDDPYGFLICSFAKKPELDEALKAVKKASASLGFKCLRVDEMPHNEDIIKQIYEGIARAAFVVADLTGNRPNCYYEVGYADALKRPVIPIARKGVNVHFDLGTRNFIYYENGADLERSLKKRILGTILYSAGPFDEEDPHKGEFGRYALVNNYLVAGTMNIDLDGREYFHVHLKVKSIKPRRPLTGSVKFHLHHSFSKSVRTVKAKDGVAELDFWTYGAFTVGVQLLESKTRLELDLKDLPGSTDDFRAL